MSTYKTQLLEALSQRGWELFSQDSHGIDWWADEVWTIRSVRERWGYELVLTFLVDPMWEGPRKKGRGVWAVAASAGVPTDRCDAQANVCLWLNRGRFDEALVRFVSDLDRLRAASARGEGPKEDRG